MSSAHWLLSHCSHTWLLIYTAPTDYDIRAEIFQVGGPGGNALCQGRYLWIHIDSSFSSTSEFYRTRNITKYKEDLVSEPLPVIFVDEIIVNPSGLGDS